MDCHRVKAPSVVSKR